MKKVLFLVWGEVLLLVCFGSRMAKWWERSPPANVSRVLFPDPASYVGWVCCASLLCSEGFSPGSPVFLSPQKPTGNNGWRATLWKWHTANSYLFFLLHFFIIFCLTIKIVLAIYSPCCKILRPKNSYGNSKSDSINSIIILFRNYSSCQLRNNNFRSMDLTRNNTNFSI